MSSFNPNREFNFDEQVAMQQQAFDVIEEAGRQFTAGRADEAIASAQAEYERWCVPGGSALIPEIERHLRLVSMGIDERFQLYLETLDDIKKHGDPFLRAAHNMGIIASALANQEELSTLNLIPPERPLDPNDPRF